MREEKPHVPGVLYMHTSWCIMAPGDGSSYRLVSRRCGSFDLSSRRRQRGGCLCAALLPNQNHNNHTPNQRRLAPRVGVMSVLLFSHTDRRRCSISQLLVAVYGLWARHPSPPAVLNRRVCGVYESDTGIVLFCDVPASSHTASVH